MIAVAGGTGRLGTQLVSRLHDRGLCVRVLTRDPVRARHLRHLGVEIVTADVRDRTGIRSALEGASTVVSAVHGFAGPGRVSPASVDHAGNANLIDAAAAVHAEVILMSAVGAAPDHPMELLRAKHAAERHLMASRVLWTIVRATAFIELWAEILQRGIVFGRGENPINFVPVADVGAAVEEAIVDPALRGQVLEIAGPENLTLNQLAARVQRTRGRSRRVRHVPRAALRLAGPLSRRARAALVMDTSEMTFGRIPPRAAVPRPEMRRQVGSPG